MNQIIKIKFKVKSTKMSYLRNFTIESLFIYASLVTYNRNRQQYKSLLRVQLFKMFYILGINLWPFSMEKKGFNHAMYCKIIISKSKAKKEVKETNDMGSVKHGAIF